MRVRNVRNMSESSFSDRYEVSEMSERPLGLGHSDAPSDAQNGSECPKRPKEHHGESLARALSFWVGAAASAAERAGSADSSRPRKRPPVGARFSLSCTGIALSVGRSLGGLLQSVIYAIDQGIKNPLVRRRSVCSTRR